MPPDTCSIIQIEAAVPSRWMLGEPRNVRLRLRNDSGLELRGCELRFVWAEELGEAPMWRRVGHLKPTRDLELVESCPAPGSVREDLLHIELRLNVGSYQELELRSEKLPAKAKVLQQISKLVVRQVIGDNVGMGQESSTVANQIQIPDPAEKLEAWLADDKEAGRERKLNLYVAKEVCRAWENAHGLQLRGIPAGEFKMGAGKQDDPQAEAHENPHWVTLSRACWMSAHPVTNQQYTKVRGLPPPERAAEFATHLGDAMPVTCLTWAEAGTFCDELTVLEQQAGTLPPGYVYRLPTEAEWEHACRAGTPGSHYGKLEQIACTIQNGDHFGEVGRYLPNEWGLCDMLGLVFEWCEDVYGPYAGLSLTDPLRLQPASCEPLRRVVRGGCYMSQSSEVRASARHATVPERRSNQIGFRVVLAPVI